MTSLRNYCGNHQRVFCVIHSISDEIEKHYQMVHHPLAFIDEKRNIAEKADRNQLYDQSKYTVKAECLGWTSMRLSVGELPYWER